jgi:hypothetical protein
MLLLPFFACFSYSTVLHAQPEKTVLSPSSPVGLVEHRASQFISIRTLACPASALQSTKPHITAPSFRVVPCFSAHTGSNLLHADPSQLLHNTLQFSRPSTTSHSINSRPLTRFPSQVRHSRKLLADFFLRTLAARLESFFLRFVGSLHLHLALRFITSPCNTVRLDSSPVLGKSSDLPITRPKRGIQSASARVKRTTGPSYCYY